MWRWLTIFLFGGALGAAFGVALGFFLFPFVFPPPEAMEQLTPAERGKLIAKGAFIHANPSVRSTTAKVTSASMRRGVPKVHATALALSLVRKPDADLPPRQIAPPPLAP